MIFRKSKNDGFEQNRWSVFCANNKELIASIDLPSAVVENHERFEDLLMHGYLDHHDDPVKFAVDQLDSAKLEKFSALVVRYFEAGYFDPGLMAVSHEERLRLSKKFPDQFDKSLRES